MSDSDKLRHFPATDPPTPASNSAIRVKLCGQIEEFINNGGTITALTNQDYTPHRINMKRPDLVNYLKKKFYKRRWNNGRHEW